jgi:FKBP-type peptidyl-prolyl cis-trans isomerase 2
MVEEPNKADFVKIDYTGTEKVTGQIFDTTIEEDAKKAGSKPGENHHHPIVMIAGQGLLIKGFEKALESMKEGETKEVDISPEEGYGPRDQRLVQVVPLSVFKKNNVDPKPGMMINSENGVMRIMSVSGGRVQVDFNHVLAGKNLKFKITLYKRLKTDEERINALLDMIFHTHDKKKYTININGKELTIGLPAEILKIKDLQSRKISLIEQIKKYTSIEKVSITEQY